MSSVQLFQHPDLGSLTTYIDDSGKEYYKVNDVCISLRLSNPSQQITRNVKAKWVFKFNDGYSKSGEALYVSEPGLYALIFKSKTLQAEQFQDWVFEDVLPKLRSQGLYITRQQNESLAEYQSREAHLVAENNKLKARNKQLQSKNGYISKDLSIAGCCTTYPDLILYLKDLYKFIDFDEYDFCRWVADKYTLLISIDKMGTTYWGHTEHLNANKFGNLKKWLGEYFCDRHEEHNFDLLETAKAYRPTVKRREESYSYN
jgi:prophage antirepressor-like protein